ncbi:MAG TPA: DUF192 domain-containing protein [Xanthobacteraceae bacterium]|jgi:hypothetical protein
MVRQSVLLLTLALGFVPLLGVTSVPAMDKGTLEIVTKTGIRVFNVDVAVTDEEREKGLMFRTDVPDGYGMLFDFKQDQLVTMWMKNTLVSLDMIFIRRDGTIARIAENTEIKSEHIIPSGEQVRAVLEVAGGTAKKYGIAPGDKVGYPIFNGH